MIVFSPFKFWVDQWGKYSTLLLQVGWFEIDLGFETSLLVLGWYQGDFCFDLLYFRGIKSIVWRDK